MQSYIGIYWAIRARTKKQRKDTSVYQCVITFNNQAKGGLYRATQPDMLFGIDTIQKTIEIFIRFTIRFIQRVNFG